MKFTTTALIMATASRLASAYSLAADSVACYALPDTESAIIDGYSNDQQLDITCQTEGSSVNGSTIWDLTEDGCYVADTLVNTGSDSYVADSCEAIIDLEDEDDFLAGDDDADTSLAERDEFVELAVRSNNYPYKNKCTGVDPWLFYKCQCTSFVAFRVNKVLKKKFTNHYKDQAWGNANSWDEAARKSAGVTINKKPKKNCIAQSNKGSYGHVAWVTGVSGKNVKIEEYNWAHRKAYGKRTVPKTTFSYIHL